MKITQIAGFRLLDSGMQHSVETMEFSSRQVAQMVLQSRLPHHVVAPERTGLHVKTRDGSFTVARFSLE
jgi:hypothetical protein